MAAFAFLLIISTAANAQAIRTRIHYKCIANGAGNRVLTYHKTRQLTRQQKNIRHDTRRANLNIARKKHNRRNRI